MQDASVAALGSGATHRVLAQGDSEVATPVGSEGDGYHEPESTFFATAFVESSESIDTDSDGDLWPCTWADDGQVYLLNGDGYGFDKSALWSDIVMNRISGTPETGIEGERLAAGTEIAPIWGDPERYNRKPTGLVAVDGDGDGRDELYAAIQDLRHGEGAFDDAPNASIVVSRDYGRTWQATAEPMFTDHVFTTIFFLDFGQSNTSASVLGPEGAGYVYAYGIDFNWRDSFSDTVEDPTDLYLARVPVTGIQDRDAWEFFAGLDGDAPTWGADIDGRVPVLTDTRRVYPDMRGPGIHDMTVISQGSVVYNQPLDRYIYSSWTEYTFEFYEAPRPWGPWKLFLRKDFGGYPWFGGGDDSCITPKNGGYATVIPSKFISDDGRTMWVQANWFVEVGCGAPNYNFSLRKLVVEPFVSTEPENSPSAEDNLAMADGVTPIEKSTHFGQEDVYNDGATDRFDDSFDREEKSVDFWGYTWPRSYNLNRVVYTTGPMHPDGGWFERDLRVQVRRDFTWHDVEGLSISPDYPAADSTESFSTYTLAFDDTWGDGVRVIGTPGGRSRFTSISELEVYFALD
ncbi:MAG TPA: DUF4185 domain-containing protein [Thermomicrobiales bacterium]|nr:DUF4185 domain-containing protein [Thermomicrobiales bacterium]